YGISPADRRTVVHRLVGGVYFSFLGVCLGAVAAREGPLGNHVTVALGCLVGGLLGGAFGVWIATVNHDLSTEPINTRRAEP
ncbi:MAG: hypothetical protein KDA60_23300, partial [Planctomycetales bacterium]|nr:hypothetical protein [Planctomycetales bacterium]